MSDRIRQELNNMYGFTRLCLNFGPRCPGASNKGLTRENTIKKKYWVFFLFVFFTKNLLVFGNIS